MADLAPRAGVRRPSQSVMGPMLNLQCAGGHRYFSPQPSRWVGRHCKPYRGIGDRCTFKLWLIPRSER